MENNRLLLALRLGSKIWKRISTKIGPFTICGFLVLPFQTAFAEVPVFIRPAEKFSASVRGSVDAIWETQYSSESNGLLVEFNLAQCKVFREYTHNLLLKLIKSSELESATDDLYMSVSCGNLVKGLGGAKLISRTLIINHGYFAFLETEDMIAALLAHELAHHILRHEDIIEPMRQQVASGNGSDMFEHVTSPELLRLEKAIKKNEREADLVSVAILANAGYSFVGALNLLNVVATHSFGSSRTHADFEERLDLIEAEAHKLNLVKRVSVQFPDEVRQAAIQYFEGEHSRALYKPGSRRFRVFARDISGKTTL